MQRSVDRLKPDLETLRAALEDDRPSVAELVASSPGVDASAHYPRTMSTPGDLSVQRFAIKVLLRWAVQRKYVILTLHEGLERVSAAAAFSRGHWHLEEAGGYFALISLYLAAASLTITSAAGTYGMIVPNILGPDLASVPATVPLARAA